MEKVIHCALVTSKKHAIDTVVAEGAKQSVIFSVYHSVQELENTEYHDVIFLHESFLTSFDRTKFANSSLVIIAEKLEHIPELYPKVGTMNVFTIISMPLEPQQAVQYARNAYTALIQAKKQALHAMEGSKKVIITSFANGTGKSLIAYNLAHKLSSFFPENSVSLIDMNSPFSMGKATLNIEERYSWNTLRPVLKEGKAGVSKIANIVYKTPYTFSFLAGPTDYSENKPLSTKEFGNLLESMEPLFRSIIVDMHTCATETDIAYLDNADVILVVVDMNAASVLQTKRGMEYITRHAPQLLDKMRFVVNKVDPEKGRTAELLATRIQVETYTVVDNDPDAVMHYMEQGKLLDDKTLLLDAQMYELAEKIVRDVF